MGNRRKISICWSVVLRHLSAMVGHSHNFDWSTLSTLLTSSSPIPGDIKFKVVDKEDGLVTTFQAHKFILGLHSDHFNNAFFGSGVNFKEEEDGFVVIKDATKEAFEDFLGFNYEKHIKFEKKTLRELYDVLNLAEMYQVKELRDVVCDFIQNFPLSTDNVVKSAATAVEFLHFNDASQALFASCVAFTKTLFTNADSVLNFIQRQDYEATVMKLLKDVRVPVPEQRHYNETTLMKLLKDQKVSGDCSNCRQKPCRNNSDISANDLLVPDMMVRTTTDWNSDGCRWTFECQQKLCRVVSIKSSDRFSVIMKEAPVMHPRLSDPFEVGGINNWGYSSFTYACKNLLTGADTKRF